MNDYIVNDLAHDRQREAQRQAAAARLVAIARCCHVTTISKLLVELRTVLTGRVACC